MSDSTGKFVWYDLMTNDMNAATAFYQKVIGWQTMDSGLPDRAYTVLSMGQSMVGGIMPIPAAASGMPPSWTGYIGVDDVDAYAAKVIAAGGTVRRPPEDIPTIGRFAVAADPHGAGFILFKGIGNQSPDADVPGAPGHIGWRELQAGDLASEWTFYSTLFGWTSPSEMDMGPMGVYRMFVTGCEMPVGGMMTKMPETPAPFWLYYFNVETLEAAIDRATAAGGKLLMGPQEVPGGQWIAQLFDPEGAIFAIVAFKR